MHRLPILLLLAASLLLAHATDAPGDVQAVFSKAAQLLEAGHYAEAVPLLKDVTSRAPDRPGGVMNLGLAAAESGDHRLALQAWSRYHQMVLSATAAAITLLRQEIVG
jgi:predicted Zn-dependent protease